MVFSATSRTGRTFKVTPKVLARRWSIGLQTAKDTLARTTQRGIHDLRNTVMGHRIKPSCYQLKYRHIRSNFFTDTLFSNVTSLTGHKCGQIFINNLALVKFYPMKQVKDAHLALTSFHHEVGVPPIIYTDGHRGLTQGEFACKVRGSGFFLKTTEPFTWRQNLAENGIKELKRLHRRSQHESNSPSYLWDHSLQLQAAIRSNTVHDIYDLQGEVPTTAVTGDTADISNLAEF